MINMLAQVLKEDSRVHSLYEEHCGQDQQLSPVNCSGSRKWFKDSEMELITGSGKIEELASWLEERKHVLHEVVEVIVDDAISLATTDGPQSSSRITIKEKIKNQFQEIIKSQNEKVEKLESSVALLQQHVKTLKLQVDKK